MEWDFSDSTQRGRPAQLPLSDTTSLTVVITSNRREFSEGSTPPIGDLRSEVSVVRYSCIESFVPFVLQKSIPTLSEMLRRDPQEPIAKIVIADGIVKYFFVVF